VRVAAWSTTFRPGPGARTTDRSSTGTASTGSSASRARTAEQSTHVHSLAPPGAPAAEYNTAIDPIGTQVVIDDSDLVVWQIPRNAYREALASFADTGAYTGEVVPDRTIRVWSDLDTCLLMADLNAKLT
jgi:hypothetical protein